MESIPYPLSESEGERPTPTDSEDDVLDLTNISVEREILRGNQLRLEKFKSSHQEHPRGVDIPNIDILKPICTDQKEQHRKTSANKIKGFRKCSPNSHFTATPYTRPDSPNLRKYGPVQDSQTNKSKLPRCPLRIAELAVPSKRQCIETWRERCHTLPGYMVERLKQQVMDQTPVVGIPDALHSFKKKRPDPVKRSCKKIRSGYDDQMKEIKGLCGVFGMQISKILMIPVCITLNPRLAKLSEVIAGDMNELIKRSKRFAMDKSIHHKILTEMSGKVAVWIENILVEASYKLLEDDLRVQRNTYRRLGKEDKLVTLIEKTFGLEVMSDLEEEEGPVLDFIDDLVENVVSFCEPPMDMDEFYGSSPDGSGSYERKLINEEYEKSIDSPNSTENLDFDTSSSEQNYTTVYDTGESITPYKSAQEHELGDSPTTQSLNTNELQSTTDDKLMIKLEEVEEEHLSENISYEILSILDMIVNDVTLPEDDKNQEFDGEKYEDTHELQTMTSYQLNGAFDAIHKEDESNEDSSEINIPITIETDISIEDIENIDNDQNNENVSEIFEIFSGELTDDKSKKVKFSNNMVNSKPRKLIENSKSEDEQHFKDSEQISWNPSVEYFIPDINIRPSNQDLLSDADEVWPQDAITPMLRATQSVSKSITSLGRILETDETVFASIDISSLDINTVSERKYFESSMNAEFKHLDEVSRPSTPVEVYITETELETASSEVNKDNKAKYSKELLVVDGKNNENIVTKPITRDIRTVEHIDSIDELVTPFETSSNVNLARDDEIKINTVSAEGHAGLKLEAQQEFQTNDHDDIQEAFVDISIVKNIEVDEQTGHKPNDNRPLTKAGSLTSVNSNTFEDKLDTALKNLSTEEQEFYIEKSHSYDNFVEVLQDKVETSGVLTEVKLSYKVQPNNPPSWVSRGHGDPSDDSIYSEAKDKITMPEVNSSQWCKDLDQGFKNIEMWNNWISDMCHNIMYVQSRYGLAIPQKVIMKHWLHLKKNIDKDTILWKKLNQRGHDRLKIYKKCAKKSQSLISCGDSKSHTEQSEGAFINILERIHSFDRLCLLMHRQIVSTEYCVCNCKRNLNTLRNKRI